MKKLVPLLLLPLLAACSGPQPVTPKNADTPTSGKINIAVDQEYSPILYSEINTFEADYKDASFNAVYVPEGEAVQRLLNDSARLIVISRDLTEQEKEIIKADRITPKSFKIANDAIALIVSPDNPLKNITYPRVKSLLKGEIKDWKELREGGSGQVTLVLNNPQSGTTRFLKELIGSDKFGSNVYAVKSDSEVINFVSKNPNAIGFIGAAWINDPEDPDINVFIKSVRALEVSGHDTSRFKEQFFGPFPSYIATRQYPLCREVYAIRKEPYAGLGTGFVSFLGSQRGQTIFLKSGLVPATMPVRLIQTSQD